MPNKVKDAIRLTADQQKARDHQGSDIIVSASAGAGKTAVLVEYIYKKVGVPQSGEKVSIRQILAMTFTDAAANSMKKKLFQRMKKDLTEQEKEDGYDEEHLKKEAEYLPSADICTIDSFCTKILSQYCYVLGWDPERPKTVLDKNTVTKLKYETAHELVLESYDPSKDLLYEMLSSYTDNGSNFNGFEDLLVTLADASDKYADEEGWKERIQRYYAARKFTDLDGDLQDAFFETMSGRVETIIDLLENYEKASQGKPLMDAALADVAIWKQSYQEILKLLEEHDTRAFAKLETMDDFKTKAKLFPVSRKKQLSEQEQLEKDCFERYRDDYEPYQKQLSSLWSDLRDATIQCNDLGKHNARMKERVGLLLDMLEEYKARVDEKKDELNAIDFTDMEKAAIEILQKDESIRNRLRDRYRYILVDEYQDTNDIQEQLVRLICRDDPGNVFRVGDIKQSIYGFRDAKPAIMRDIMAKAKEDEKVVFHDNFRSSAKIIGFNNLVYRTLMNIPHFKDSFTDENDLAKAGTASQDGYQEKVELHLIDYVKREDDKRSPKDLRIIQSDYIARQIAQMHAESVRRKEELPKEERDDKTLLYKKGIFADWKDYVILVKNHDFKKILEKSLKAYGIPLFFVMNKGYYDDVAVQTVISWLSFLADQNDEIAMFSILTSPYYGISNDDMTDLALELKKRNRESDKKLTMRELVNEKYPQFREDYLMLRNIYRQSGLTKLLRSIIDLHDFYYCRTTAEQRDDLDLFYEKCVSVRDMYSDIESLLDWLEINQKADEGAATSVSAESNVVRIVTIHYSKGLEFPVVFYAGGPLSKPSNKNRFRSAEKAGLALDIFEMPYRISYKPLLWQLIDNAQKQETIEEQIRLMYVATTRPMAKLVIVAFENSESVSSFTYGGLSAAAGDICSVGDLLRDVCVKQPEMKNYCEVFHTGIDDIEQAEVPETIPENKEYTVRKYEAKDEGYGESSASGKEEREVYRITYRDRIDNALRGTLIHKAYELLDFKDPRIEDIDVPLSEEDKAKIMKFFDHDLAKQLAKMELYPELPYALMDEKDGKKEYLHGFMDLVAMDDEKIILLDYKSDVGKTPQEYIDAYKGQQLAYKRGLEQLGKPITCYLYALELDEFIEIKE